MRLEWRAAPAFCPVGKWSEMIDAIPPLWYGARQRKRHLMQGRRGDKGF